ncbi:MAG: aminotransferase class V-fold PLP-dependent enzyme [Ruminococcus sp.]|nr:aminotransferase class V-fold PLP-dependent enzyme [Ruminococcus sp.]
MSIDFETKCVHGFPEKSLKEEYRSISFPIYQTASFSHIKTGHNESGFDYTRESNPTRQRVEEVVASLENAEYAVAFTSGMAAVTAVLELFEPDTEIICSEDLYGGVIRLHNIINIKNGIYAKYTDTSEEAEIFSAISEKTRAIYVETPSNPMMNITDIHLTADIAHKNGLVLIVDNTFLSPYFQNPLELGADIVIHSGSKFLSGHNDTISGFVCTNNKKIADQIRLISKTTGAALSPFDSWLVIRGIKTLAVRMERQQENAVKLVDFLMSHRKVTHVYYPALSSHKGCDVNKSQARGSGSMISFNVDSPKTAEKLLKNVKIAIFAESLGGTETLITYPVLQTHPDVPKGMRDRLGINDTLLRMSVGLENADDIINDIAQALED